MGWLGVVVEKEWWLVEEEGSSICGDTPVCISGRPPTDFLPKDHHPLPQTRVYLLFDRSFNIAPADLSIRPKREKNEAIYIYIMS